MFYSKFITTVPLISLYRPLPVLLALGSTSVSLLLSIVLCDKIEKINLRFLQIRQHFHYSRILEFSKLVWLYLCVSISSVLQCNTIRLDPGNIALTFDSKFRGIFPYCIAMTGVRVSRKYSSTTAFHSIRPVCISGLFLSLYTKLSYGDLCSIRY